MFTQVEKIKAAREGADVQRFHTSRTIRTNTVGLHSFNMLSMLRILYPDDPPIELVWAILEHDIPERWIGDTPAPAKWWGILNKEAELNTEVMLTEEIFGEFHGWTKNTELIRWLRGLDILECICEIKDELLMGNDAMKKIYVRAVVYAKSNAANYPKEIIDAIYEVDHDSWEPVRELGE